MNILDYKRKTLGYTFLEGSDGWYDSGTGNNTVNTTSKYITIAGGPRGDDNISIPNPNYIPPNKYEAERARIAASLGVPISSVEPQYGTKIGGRDDNTAMQDTDNVVGFAVKKSNNLGLSFNTAGVQTGTYDPSYRSGNFVDDLFGGISNALADLDSSLGLSKNAPTIIGAAAAYFLPGIGQALGQSLVNAGVLTGAAATPAAATAIGTALTQTGIGVAQGQSLDQALGNAIISGGMGELSRLYGADVKAAISQVADNPIAQNAILKAGTGVVSAVAQGKSGDEVLQGIGRSVVSTVAGAAANEAVKNIPGIENLSPAQQNIVKSGIATSIQGGDGTKSMVNAAITAGTNYVLDAVTSTPGATAANPMSQDPAQQAGAATVDPVAQLYRDVLGREPDADGLVYWRERFGSDVDPTEIKTFADIAKTAEPNVDVEENLRKAGLSSAETSPVTQSDVVGTDLPPITGTGKPGESNMAQTASQTGGTSTANSDEWGDLQGAIDAAAARGVNSKAPTFSEAFSSWRTALGPGKQFPWTNPKTGETKLFTTDLAPDQITQGDQEVLGELNPSRAGTRVGLPITTTEGKSYLTTEEKSVNQRISEAYEGSTLSKIIGTPEDAMQTLIAMKDVALGPGKGVISGIKGIADAYGIITGDIGNPVSQSMRGLLNNVDYLTSDKAKSDLKTMQSMIDAAAKDGQGSAAWETAKQLVTHPYATAGLITESIGTVFPALAVAAPMVAAGVPLTAAASTAVAVNALVQGGSVAQSAYDFIIKQTAEDPSLSPEQKISLALTAGRQALVPATAISAAINSLPGGKIFEKALLGSSIGVGKTSLIEALQEIPEETLGKVAENWDKGQDLTTGLGQTSVTAGVAGAGAGAIAGSSPVTTAQATQVLQEAGIQNPSDSLVKLIASNDSLEAAKSEAESYIAVQAVNDPSILVDQDTTISALQKAGLTEAVINDIAAEAAANDPSSIGQSTVAFPVAGNTALNPVAQEEAETDLDLTVVEPAAKPSADIANETDIAVDQPLPGTTTKPEGDFSPNIDSNTVVGVDSDGNTVTMQDILDLPADGKKIEPTIDPETVIGVDEDGKPVTWADIEPNATPATSVAPTPAAPVATTPDIASGTNTTPNTTTTQDTTSDTTTAPDTKPYVGTTPATTPDTTATPITTTPDTTTAPVTTTPDVITTPGTQVTTDTTPDTTTSPTTTPDTTPDTSTTPDTTPNTGTTPNTTPVTTTPDTAPPVTPPVTPVTPVTPSPVTPTPATPVTPTTVTPVTPATVTPATVTTPPTATKTTTKTTSPATTKTTTKTTPTPQTYTKVRTTEPGALVGKTEWDEEGPIDYTPFLYTKSKKDTTDEEEAKMAKGGSVDELLAMLGIYEQDDSQSTGDQHLDELLRALR